MSLPPLTTLTLARTGAIARIGINRPAVRNALNLAVAEELTALLGELAGDPSLSVLVLLGEGGKAFASGADIAELHARRSPEAMRAFNARMFQAVEDFPRPTIAAISGYALGGGLELALACDLRLATRSAKLGLPETGLGIFPGAGGTWRLPRVVGLGRAKELVYTGRIVSGEEALALGLVERLCEDDQLEASAMAFAGEIARNAPLALQIAKVSFQAAARGGDPTVAERLGQALLFDSEEKQRRMGAFLARRQQPEAK
jgi:enoyl-CoA hydratase